MSQIWFTSDTHYHHKNICRGVSQWDRVEENDSHQSTRNFKNLDEMNDAIVKGINKKVKYDDTLYHIGDWSFGGIEQIYNFWKQLVCKNIHLIYGNHDQHIEANKILPNAITTQDEKDYWDSDLLVAQRLFLSTQYVKTIKAVGQSIFLSHYAHRVWDKSHHGRIHLYGHSHSTLEDVEWGKSMDVGVDSYYKLHKKYEPFSLTEILEIMSKRSINFVDHHNSATN